MKARTYGAVSVTAHDRLFRNLEDVLTFITVARRHDVLLVYGRQVIDYDDPSSEFVSVLLGANATRENRVRTEWLRQSRRKKAEQGIASTTCPVGYVTGGGGTWMKDPDPCLRDAISLVFDKFDELKSGSAVWRYFRRNGIQLRDRRGTWRNPLRGSIVNILRNCAYAGVYQFGKTETDYSRDPSPRGDRHRRLTPAERRVWLEDHHDPYVSLDRWVNIQRQLNDNKDKFRPFPGRGESLLQGLMKCALHQRVLCVNYNTRPGLTERAGHTRLGAYRCSGTLLADPDGRSCCQAMASLVDHLVEAELFRVLTPPSIEEIRESARKELREHEARVRAREIDLGRAQQAVAEAERMLGEVDADQPLLRRRLRERIEEALEAREKLASSHARNPLVPAISFDDAELAELGELLRDLPALWRHPAVTALQRKTVVRTVIEAIVVTPRSEGWTLDVEWKGSGRTRLELLTHEGALAVIRAEYLRGRTVAEIVATLAARGVVQRAACAGSPFSTRVVRHWISRMKLQSRFDVEAYAHIRDRYLQGVRVRVIADELNSRGLRHRRGEWDVPSVRAAISRLRRRPIPGVDPLGPAPHYQATITELHEAGLSPKEIVHRLAQSGIQTRIHQPITHSAVLQALHKRGLRSNSVVAADQINALLGEWAASTTPGDIAKRLNERALRTLRGKPWTAGTVRLKLTKQRLYEPARVRLATAVSGWGEPLDLAEIARRVNKQGLRNRRGNPWTEKTLRRQLLALHIAFRRRRGKPGVPVPTREPGGSNE